MFNLLDTHFKLLEQIFLSIIDHVLTDFHCYIMKRLKKRHKKLAENQNKRCEFNRLFLVSQNKKCSISTNV